MSRLPIGAVYNERRVSVRSFTFNTSSNGWTGYTFRCVFNPAGLTVPDFFPVRARLQLTGALTGSENFDLTAAAIGHLASTYSFAAAPIPVTFEGNATVTVPQNGSIFSDWVPFAWNKATGIVVAVYGANSAHDNVGANSSSSNVGYYFKSGINDVNTVSASGYTSGTPSYALLVSSIEIAGY